jgi:hypothetical protein
MSSIEMNPQPSLQTFMVRREIVGDVSIMILYPQEEQEDWVE